MSQSLPPLKADSPPPPGDGAAWMTVTCLPCFPASLHPCLPPGGCMAAGRVRVDAGRVLGGSGGGGGGHTGAANTGLRPSGWVWGWGWGGGAVWGHGRVVELVTLPDKRHVQFGSRELL